MHKLVPSFILLLLSSVMAFGQYANTTNVDVTSTKGYKQANTAFYCGIITASVGAVAWLAGAGIAWFGSSRMKKIKNAAGQTVATIGYAPTENGIAIAMRF